MSGDKTLGTRLPLAMADHDSNLRNLLQRCREKGVKLNGGKVQLRRKEVSYMGHTLTEEGLMPDACKVKAVHRAVAKGCGLGGGVEGRIAE